MTEIFARDGYGKGILNRGLRSLLRGGLILAGSAVSALSVGLILDAPVVHAETVDATATSPADGEVLATSPSAITITFNQPIGSAATTVIACNGSPAPQTAPTVSSDLMNLVVDLTAIPLPKGTCTVRWAVTAINEPGVQSDSFSFEIQQDSVATTVPVVVDATASSSDPASASRRSKR